MTTPKDQSLQNDERGDASRPTRPSMHDLEHLLAWCVSNRDLTHLEFLRRVLEEALDESEPLLERLKFLSIFSSNLDEFFMVRVSGLKEMLDYEDIGMMPGELMPAECDVLSSGGPGALVAVLATGGVVPAVLVREEVVRVGDRLGVLVTDHDAPAVEDPVAERVARGVDEVLPAGVAAERGPVLVLHLSVYTVQGYDVVDRQRDRRVRAERGGHARLVRVPDPLRARLQGRFH